MTKKKYSVLIADDEKNTCEGIKQSLDQDRFLVDTVNNLHEAITLWDEREHDIVITDLRMPDGPEGMELLQHIRKNSPTAAVIIMTAYGDIETAVIAMKLGALDFITKPFTAEEIELKIDNAVKTINLISVNKCLCQEIADENTLIGISQVIQELKRKIVLVAKSDSRVLISGPHGTGKELVAWAIQKASARADKPFVRVNCAAIADTLIEAELFGSEKGAYTNSVERKIGKFLQADRGTLFLDEVGDMSLAAQAKVLRVLEAGEITPVGSTKTLIIDVRVISASNKNLPALIEDGKFREDLYFRLNAVPINTPRLAEHKDDIPILIEHFLTRMGRATAVELVFSKEAIDCLIAWNWPGNVRELKNVIERALIFSGNGKIELEEIQDYFSLGKKAPDAQQNKRKSLKGARSDFEREFIGLALKESKTIAEAAERLGLQRPYLYQKMKELGIGG